MKNGRRCGNFLRIRGRKGVLYALNGHPTSVAANRRELKSLSGVPDCPGRTDLDVNYFRRSVGSRFATGPAGGLSEKPRQESSEKECFVAMKGDWSVNHL